MKESETLELKTSTSELKEAIISIVSILNKHQKGKLYFGVKNNIKIVEQASSSPRLSGREQNGGRKGGRKTVEYNIESLKKKGVLRRVGSAKGGYWKIYRQE